MATKKKGMFQRIVDNIGDLVRQPMSDESNETPTAKAVKQSKAVAAGKRRSKPSPKAKARKGLAGTSSPGKSKPLRALAFCACRRPNIGSRMTREGHVRF